MQADLNNILLQQGLLELTRTHPNGFETQQPLKIQQNLSIQLLDTGVLLVEPESNSRVDLVISSGVHGNETAPIEIVDTLVRKILNGDLTVGNRVLFIIGNPVAMNMSERFDVENMNRLFNGKHQGKQHHEAKRAARLEQYVENFFHQNSTNQRIHYDLHTAIRASKYKKFAVYPYPDGREWNKAQLEFFLASDINTILLGHQPSGTFSYFSSHRFKADAFTVELGKVKPFGENNMDEFQAISVNLATLIRGDKVQTKPFDNADFNLFQVKGELVKKSEAFKLNIADDVENFTDFKQGFVLTEDESGGYVVEKDGEAIVFPNAKIPVGQRAGLIVVKTQI